MGMKKKRRTQSNRRVRCSAWLGINGSITNLIINVVVERPSKPEGLEGMRELLHRMLPLPKSSSRRVPAELPAPSGVGCSDLLGEKLIKDASTRMTPATTQLRQVNRRQP
jgi:hypothetical protein